MFRFFIVLGMLSIASAFAVAQDEKLDELAFDEEPEYEEESEPYFGFAIGYTGSFLFQNLDETNAKTTELFNLEEISTPLYANGIEVFTSTFFVDNLRFAFFSQSASNLSERDTTIDNSKYFRNAEYSVNYTGFAFDYCWVVAKSLTIAPGIGFLRGGVDIEFSQNPESTSWETAPNDPNAYFLRYSAGFWFVEPRLAVELSLTKFSTLRAAASYNLALMNEWDYNKNGAVSDVPDNISGSGFKAQFGIFIGLFNKGLFD